MDNLQKLMFVWTQLDKELKQINHQATLIRKKKDDIQKQLIRFRPDLIAISSTEDMWELGVKILHEIKDYKIKNNIPIIAG